MEAVKNIAKAMRNPTLRAETGGLGEDMNPEEDDILGCIELAEDRNDQWEAAKKTASETEENEDEEILIQCARIRNGLGHMKWGEKRLSGKRDKRDGDNRRLRVARTAKRAKDAKGPHPKRAHDLLTSVYKDLYDSTITSDPKGGSKRRRESRKRLSKKTRARNVKKTNRKTKSKRTQKKR